MAKILIIDDEPDYAQSLETLFSASGHEVKILDNCDSAIEEIRSEVPDLLILDVMFPENAVAGFDLAREVRAEPDLAGLPIMLFSNINQEFPLDISSDDIDPDWMPVQEFIDKSSPLGHVLRSAERLLRAT